MKRKVNCAFVALLFISGCCKQSSLDKGNLELSLTTGSWNFLIGRNAGSFITTGSYNFCYGDDSCRGVTTENCIIEITPLSQQTLKEIQIEIHGVGLPLPNTDWFTARSKVCGVTNTTIILDNILFMEKTGSVGYFFMINPDSGAGRASK